MFKISFYYTKYFFFNPYSFPNSFPKILPSVYILKLLLLITNWSKQYPTRPDGLHYPKFICEIGMCTIIISCA